MTQVTEQQLAELPENVRRTISAFTQLIVGANSRKDQYLLARIDEAIAYATVEDREQQIASLKKQLGERERHLNPVGEPNANEGK